MPSTHDPTEPRAAEGGSTEPAAAGDAPTAGALTDQATGAPTRGRPARPGGLLAAAGWVAVFFGVALALLVVLALLPPV
ncbi:MAG: hypothetical protein ACFCGT_25025 [Sandaracinaceae bacterium]